MIVPRKKPVYLKYCVSLDNQILHLDLNMVKLVLFSKFLSDYIAYKVFLIVLTFCALFVQCVFLWCSYNLCN